MIINLSNTRFQAQKGIPFPCHSTNTTKAAGEVRETALVSVPASRDREIEIERVQAVMEMENDS